MAGKKNMALIERLRRENDEFFSWEERHKRLEHEIRDLNKKHVLTPEEEVLRKNLQKEKLLAKDKATLFIKVACPLFPFFSSIPDSRKGQDDRRQTDVPDRAPHGIKAVLIDFPDSDWCEFYGLFLLL